MVTPDLGPLAARLMGWCWWHYRIFGYFNRRTLTQAVSKAGLRPIAFHWPSWHFPASYLMTRVLSYLLSWLSSPVPWFLDRILVPLNLFDSILVIPEKSR